MNEVAAKEWLNKAWHHYGSANILYQAEHYTDTIAVDLHYSVEIMIKSFLAYDNSKIIKIHDLNELSLLVENKIIFTFEEQEMLAVISKYHIKGSYPIPDRKMPSREEIKQVLDFADELFIRVCKLLNINPEEVKY